MAWATGQLNASIGAIPEEDFIGRGRMKVVRKGRYHPVYLLQFNGTAIASLRWRGPRRVRYTILPDGEVFEMRVGPMKRKIRGLDHNGQMCRIVVNSNRNLSRRDMRVQMSNGDNFVVTRRQLDRWGSSRFEVRKQHYVNNLLVFHFDNRDLDAPIIIDVERLMRWEIGHFHWLLALITARIGLERRMLGCH
jgi:hypothetical protein